MQNRTLLVGLGGIGSTIVSKIARKINDHGTQDKIEFVTIDTSQEDIDDTKKNNNKLDNVKVSTITTSSELKVKDILARISHDRFKKELQFPQNTCLLTKDMKNGAGQIRCLSYLALIDTMKNQSNEFKKLKNAFDKLHLDKAGSISVYIISSICGGTGSGIILPIALYLRDYMDNIPELRTCKINGFFILPEVPKKHPKVKTSTQIKNIEVNAYATLKEINAFIENTTTGLDKKYIDKIKLFLPNIDASGMKQYTKPLRPFDRCYMYDGEKIDNSPLGDYETCVEHATECLYNRIIGPLNRNLNTYEVNETINCIHRNCYAGIGSSQIIYPKDHVIEYIAANWAKTAFETNWQQFDVDYVNETSKKDVLKTDTLRGDLYIKSVLRAEKQGNKFAEEIVKVTNTTNADSGLKTTKFEEYINAICNKTISSVAEDLDGNKPTIDGKAQMKGIVETLINLKNKKDLELLLSELVKKFKPALDYGVNAKNNIDTLGKDIADILFKGDEIKITNEKLEFHIMDEHNKDIYIHPNAIRYFIYQSLAMIKDKKQYYEGIADDAENDARLNKKYPLSDIIETEYEESPEDFHNKVKSGFLRRINEEEILKCVGRFQVFEEKVYQYIENKCVVAVLDRAEKYLRKLSESFGDFYDSLNEINVHIDQVVNELKEKDDYTNKDGSTIHYVCASREFLVSLLKEKQFPGDSIKLPGSITKNIYDKVKSLSLIVIEDKAKKEELRKFFKSEKLKQEVSQAFVELVKEECKGVNVDIYDAICLQESILNPKNNKEAGVKDIIQIGLGKSQPIINFDTSYQEYYTVDRMCYINSEFESVSQKFIDLAHEDLTILAPDDEIEKNCEKLIFFQSCQNIEPFDLKKISPARKTSTNQTPDGVYLENYKESTRVVDEEGTSVTPHILAPWHKDVEMPMIEIKESTVRDKKITVLQPLIQGFIFKIFSYDYDEKEYSCNLTVNGVAKKQILYFTNGRTCKSLIDLIELLKSDPALVKSIGVEIQSEINTLMADNDKYIIDLLNSFEIKELFPKLKRRVPSVFDIAATYNLYAANRLYDGDFQFEMINELLSFIATEIREITTNRDFCAKYKEIIDMQIARLRVSGKQHMDKTETTMKNFVADTEDIITKYTRQQCPSYVYSEPKSFDPEEVE